MKGVGTFRRTLSRAAALLGLGTSPSVLRAREDQAPTVDNGHEERERRKPRKSRGGKSWIKRTHNKKRVGWPIITWGVGGKPLSRKALKKIAPGSPLLQRYR